MNDEKKPLGAKLLKSCFCGFRSYVRGHVGETPPYTRKASGGDPPIRNNKYNNNIYINEVAGGSVASGRVA